MKLKALREAMVCRHPKRVIMSARSGLQIGHGLRTSGVGVVHGPKRYANNEAPAEVVNPIAFQNPVSGKLRLDA